MKTTAMKTAKLLSLSLALIGAVACSKEEPTGNKPGATDLSELSIATSFDWSSSRKGELNLNVKAPQGMMVENQELQLRDMEDNTVARTNIANGMAHFYMSMPPFDAKLFAYYPNTQESFEITASGNQVITLAEPILETFEDGFKKGTVLKMAKTVSSNIITNGDFESPITGVDNRSALDLRTSGQWYRKGNLGVQTVINGSTVFTNSSNNDNAYILQSFAHSGNHVYDFSFDYSGYARMRIITYDKNMNRIGYISTQGNGSKGGLASLFIGDNVGFIQLYIYVRNNGWVDNVSVTDVTTPDTDNDGVIDALDDYPNDATKAYATFFPLIGRQTVAFEDMWPSLGDFDFNDMVVSNLVEYSADASGNLIEATFKVRVDAVGAGIPSGVGVVLLKPNKQALSANVISSVSGDASLDPAVSNGLIVFHNVLSALGKPYANNGQGPDGEPKEFIFTVSFNSNIGQDLIIPDFYIFRSSERGREIHLDGFAPTAAANPALFNTGADVNGTYNTSNGLPWAVELIYPHTIFFKHPLEKIDILVAYPNFQQWAETNGVQQTGWMIHPNNGKVYNK